MNTFHRGPVSAPFVWMAATVIFCAIFVVASAPLARAQDQSGDSRRYMSLLQNVFDFVQQHYVDNVDPRLLYEGAMTGMLNALGDPYSVFLQESDMADLSEISFPNHSGMPSSSSAIPRRGSARFRTLPLSAPP